MPINNDLRTSVQYLFVNSTNSQYVIPVFQRNYVWNETQQIDKFLSDLRTVLQTGEPHFIGMIVDYPIPGSTSTQRQFYVIDGQQRLTTIFLIYFALLEKADAEGDVETEDLIRDYLFNKHGSPERRNKLKPLAADDRIFRIIMEGKFDEAGAEEKENNIAIGFDRIRKFVKSDLAEYSTRHILDEGMDKLTLIEFSLNQGDNAQQIFESINATGKPLSDIDLIRNYVLMAIPEEKKDDFYQNNWIKVEGSFDDDASFLAFFRQFLINRTLVYVKKNGVYDAFKGWLSSHEGQSGVESAFIEIKEFVEGYKTLIETPLDKIVSKNLREQLRDFRNIKSEMPRPYLLEAAVLYNNKKISPEEFAGILGILNSFIERRAIVGWDTSGISRTMAVLPKYVTEDVTTNGVSYLEATRFNVINRNANTAARMPTDGEIRESLWSLNVYDLKDALHVFLDRYENHGNDIPIETMGISIEHLLPQDGTKWAPCIKITEEEYSKQRNRLGNLTLATTHDNSVMSNNLFDFKKEVLKGTAHLRMNVEIYNEPEWDVAHIDARTEKLTNSLLDLYPYEPSVRTFIAKTPKASPNKYEVLPLSTELVSEWTRENARNEIGINIVKSFFEYFMRETEDFCAKYTPNGICLVKKGGTQRCCEIQVAGPAMLVRVLVPDESEGYVAPMDYYLNPESNGWGRMRMDFKITDPSQFEIARELLFASAKRIRAKRDGISKGDDWCPLNKELLAKKIRQFIEGARDRLGIHLTTSYGATYIRFTSKGSVYRGGKGGQGEWIKGTDILAYEVTILPSDHRVNFRLIIGPGDENERLRLFNFAKNNPPLCPIHPNKISKNWEAIYRFDLINNEVKTGDSQRNTEIAFERFVHVMEGDFLKIEAVLFGYEDQTN